MSGGKEGEIVIESRKVDLKNIASVAYPIPASSGEAGKGMTIEFSRLTGVYENPKVEDGPRCIIVQGEVPLILTVNDGVEETLGPGEARSILPGASFRIRPATEGQPVELVYILPEKLI